tara:strand:+ start:9194 stop:9940 length:747 start_codon:yes stop_codon:yes gene_type:complete
MSDVDLQGFFETGFDLKMHLGNYLNLPLHEIDTLLPKAIDDLAAIHPGSLAPDQATLFYEEKVGTSHLFELAAWHLNSSNYIGDTLRLLESFAKGNVLDFGGGIGTHSIFSAALREVKHVYFVDLNPENRSFVQQRAEKLGLAKRISVHRDLESIGEIKFQTLVCFDVLEHIPDPASQLLTFETYLSANSVALMNWYFYKGDNGEYPFHFDDPAIVENFFITLQSKFIEIFHPYLITARAYKLNNIIS